MKILIHQFGGYAEPTKHLDAKMTKVGMASEGGPDNYEQCGIDGCHDYERADAVRPWSYSIRVAMVVGVERE